MFKFLNMNFGVRVATIVGFIVFALALLNACSTMRQDQLTATIYPNLAQARTEGFDLLVGHPPFRVGFRSEVGGSDGTISYRWDMNGDGVSDSEEPNPEFVYPQPGEYTATVSIDDESGQKAMAEQRIVVVGEPEWPDWRYGVSSHLEKGESDSEVHKEARAIAEAGIEAVRFDLSWAATQPNSRDEYEWEKYDSLLALSQRYGFGLLPVIVYVPDWASTARDATDPEDRIFAPPSPTEYAWFAYEAANRYRDSIRAWEVWNEPNLSQFWRPEADPALYAQLLKQAYLAIKYADPTAVVVLGGLANDDSGNTPRTLLHPPEEFLQVVYDYGGRSYFDAAASHPYTHPSKGTEQLIRKLDTLANVMSNNSDAEKPLWVTEYGTAAVLKEGVTDEAQGRWLIQSLDALSVTNYATPVFWYDFRNNGDDPNDPQHNFGLVKQDFQIKPAYQAYRDYIYNN